MRKKLMIAAVTVFLTAMLSGCGTSGDEPAENTTSEGTTVSEKAAESRTTTTTTNKGILPWITTAEIPDDNPMWEILPRIPETQENDFTYHDLASGGVYIDGYTGSSDKIRVPEKIDGKEVITVDLRDKKLTEIVFPSQAILAYINTDTVEYMNYINDIVIKDSDGYNWRKLKGLYIDSDCADWLFYDAGMLTDVVLTENVHSIGERTFGDCRSLADITIPDSVESIGDYAFYGCTGLKNLSIGSGVSEIGEGSFGLCTNLSELSIPSSVKTIGDNAFYGNTGLVDVQFAEGVTKIGASAFADCTHIKDIHIPESTAYIGRQAFSECINLGKLYLGSGLREMSITSFEKCRNLKELETNVGDVKSLVIGQIHTENGSWDDTELHEADRISDYSYYFYPKNFFENVPIERLIIGDDVTYIAAIS